MKTETGTIKALGMAIRDQRRQMGFSQEEFAHLTKLDRAHVGQIERGNGNPTIALLKQMCETLEISLEELMRISGL